MQTAAAWLLLVVGSLPLAMGLSFASVGPASRGTSSSVGKGRTARWISPLRRPLVMTSSFGEYRRGHYHGGLDFSTGGRVGEPVLAPAPGEVVRLRASGVGYGKAVYFRLADGRTVVFGHLSRFSARIRSLVLAEQTRRHRYEVDFVPPAGFLRFGAGDTLALSGETGAGPPHLHAEVRVDPEADVAVNPIGRGWAVPDTIPPSLQRIRVEPAEPGVRVNGGFDPVALPLEGAVPRDTLRITGRVRVWVEASDRAVEGAYRLAPYRVAWSVDGRTLSELVLDRVDWRWPGEVAWTFQEALARSRNERWICLEPAPGGRQTVCRRLGAEAPFPTGLSEGRHRLTFTASDAIGNETRRGLFLVVSAAPVAGTPIRSAPIRRNRFVSRGRFLEYRVMSGPGVRPSLQAVPAPSEPALGGWTWTRARGGWVAQLGRPAHMGLWRFALAPASSGAGPGAVDTVTAIWIGEEKESGSDESASWWDAGRVALRIGPRDVYGSLWITVHEPGGLARKDRNRRELIPVSGEIELCPWATPLRNLVEVAVPVAPGETAKGVAVYRWDDGWSFVGADTSRGRVLGTISELETVALLRDRTPPEVHLLAPGNQARPLLRARISDRGAGFTWRNLTMRVDGKPVIAEWDPEAGLFTSHLRQDLAPGRHQWSVEASDRVGNRRVRSVGFRVG